METFLRFNGDVCLGWKWLRMWQISPAYTGASSEVGYECIAQAHPPSTKH